MLERWVEALDDQFDLTADEIADICWLAMIRQASVGVTASSSPSPDSVTTIAESVTQAVTLPESDLEALPSIPEVAPKPKPSPKKGLFSKGQSEIPGLESYPIRIPDAPAIREPLALLRAIRPLIRDWDLGPGPELDEAATVRKIAEERVLLPQTKPLTEAWLDLALVVDESSSMLTWRHTLRELNRFFKHYGAFRDVRLWGLLSSTANTSMMAVTESNNPTEAGDQTQSPVSQIYVRANPFSKLTQQSLRRPECLVEPTGRRVVIVISDCVAEMWRTSEMLRVLQLWAQQGPLVILQMMPEWLWHRTSLNQASLVILKGQAVGTANTDLAIAQSLSARRRTNLQKNEDIPVPVITLEPERFGQWTDLLTLRGEKQAPGVIFSYRNQKAAATLRKRQQQKQPNQSPNALKRTQAFQGAASPMARRLASLLAASPVISLPVIRMVQDSLLPQSKPVHVAEVLLGGILKPEKEPEPDTDPDDVVYRFVDEEIRKQLLANAPVPDTTEVLSSYIRKRFDRALHEFVAYLRDLMEQAGTEQDQIRPFATVTAAVLQYRGDNPAFTDFVEAVQQRYGTVRQARENPSPDTLDEAQSQSEFPPLQEYDYEVAKVSFEEETPSFTLQTQTLEIGTLEITSESDVVDLPQTGLEPFEFVSATIARQNSEWRIQNRTDRAYRYVERIEKQRGFIASLFRSPEEVELEMVAIPAGEFRMGAPTDESTSESEKPQHTVSVPAFFMSKYLITQAQWQAVAGWEQVNRELESEPSRFKGENLPVEQVSWHEAVEFCDRISARTGRTYRLPTEAEWEYACRAGTQTPFHFGETITAELANYRSEIAYNDGPTSKGPDKTTDVGRYPANGFGLYDMHGNLWEWCLDDYHNNYEEAPTDGSTWLSSSERKSRKVLRGGSWFNLPEGCRSAYRYYYGPDLRDNHLGFRVVCLPQDS